ncbi:hypothetical protein PABG_07622 [Paracoccidioides brasiliensis Pb03]|nr:hypothetical protein PABG_07622 [Paracoccidioides brasiliensis Pb03]
MASESSTRPEDTGLVSKKQGAGEDIHHSSSHQCMQMSTENDHVMNQMKFDDADPLLNLENDFQKSDDEAEN